MFKESAFLKIIESDAFAEISIPKLILLMPDALPVTMFRLSSRSASLRSSSVETVSSWNVVFWLARLQDGFGKESCSISMTNRTGSPACSTAKTLENIT
ncbi:MAG: hypothetical protein U0T81_13395 [Saprospiraceae bacterium]